MEIYITYCKIRRKVKDAMYIYPSNVDDWEGEAFPCGDHHYATRLKAAYKDALGSNKNIGEIVCFSRKNPASNDFNEYADIEYTMGEHFEYYQKIVKYVSSPKEYFRKIKDYIWLKIIECMDINYNLGSYDLDNLKDFSKIVDLLRGINSPITIKYNNSKLTKELKFDIGKIGPIKLNVQAFVGRNGVGKTTLMQSMISSIFNSNEKSNHMDFESFKLSKVISILMNQLDKNAFNRSKIKYSDIREDFFYKANYNEIISPGESLETKICELNMKGTYAVIDNLTVKKRRVLQKIFELFEDDKYFVNSYLRKLDFRLKIDENVYNEFFLSLGNGQKKIIITLVAILNEIKLNSFIFMDEPEANLYPGLISLYLKALKIIIDEFTSILFVFTHSPVIIQQLPRRSVWKIQRFDCFWKVDNVWFNTLGENLGRITRELFDIDIDDSLYNPYLEDKKHIAEIIDELGDEAKSIVYSWGYCDEKR